MTRGEQCGGGEGGRSSSSTTSKRGSGEDELEGDIGGVEAILLVDFCHVGGFGEFNVDALCDSEKKTGRVLD